MDILFISQDGVAPSGVSTYGYHLLRARSGARMLLLNADNIPPAAPEEVIDRISFVPTGESHDVRSVAVHVAESVKLFDGRVVILPNTGDTPWAAVVEWVGLATEVERNRVRVLGIVHSDVETQYSGAVQHAGFAAEWIGVSGRCATVLRERMGAALAKHVHELHYPMDLPPLRKRESHDQPIRLLYAGRLEESQKRVSRLPEVFEGLVKRSVSFSVVVAGEGASRRGLEERVKAGRARTNVSFAGSLAYADLRALFASCDVLILTSAFEGLPLVLLEAMAAGMCPVVMDTASGLTELIENGVSGCVVPQGDVEAMVAAIEKLESDRRKLTQMGWAARSKIAESFSPARHFPRLDVILNRCFEQPSPDPESIVGNPAGEAVASIVRKACEIGTAVAVHGAGMFGRKVVDGCLEAGLEVVAIFDSDPAKHGRYYRGIVCQDPHSMRRVSVDAILVGSLEFAREMEKQIADEFSTSDSPTPRIVVAVSGR